jgi:predicted methyltransferase
MRRPVLSPAVLALSAFALALPLATALAEPAHAQANNSDAKALAAVLADTRRDEDRARDQYRHPVETIAFFQIKPGQTVVDYMPSGGWWTRVLVPYLGDTGRYIGLNPDVRTASDRFRQMMANLGDSFPAQAAGWTGVPAVRIAAYNTDTLPDSLKGKVDRVLIFREMHNLWRMDLLRREMAAVRGLLKDDGLLGIEQHRASDSSSADYTDGNKGYLREKDVIALVEANGFDLVGKSELNRNPRDPANHKDGVWMLPPNLRGAASDADKAKMIAIGESDRMTLLFRKRT